MFAVKEPPLTREMGEAAGVQTHAMLLRTRKVQVVLTFLLGMIYFVDELLPCVA